MDKRKNHGYNANHPKRTATDKIYHSITAVRQVGSFIPMIFQDEIFEKEVISIAYLLVSLLAVAVCTDFFKQIIPNELIYIGSAACILSMASCHETDNLLRGLLQAVILFICLFPIYMVKGLGAGDVKLFMMIGLFLPREDLLQCVFAAMLLGSVVGLLKIAFTKADHKIHFSLPILISVLLKLGGVY